MEVRLLLGELFLDVGHVLQFEVSFLFLFLLALLLLCLVALCLLLEAVRGLLCVRRGRDGGR